MSAPFSTSSLATVFKTVDWIVPPYFSRGSLSNLATNIVKVSDPKDKVSILEKQLPLFYNEDYLAVMLLERYRITPHVKDFADQISESIEAYHLGLFHVAVIGMVPIIEGILRKMSTARGESIGMGTQKLIDELDYLVAKEKSSINSFNERVDMLQAFRDFVAKKFLENTNDYNGVGNLNRHGLLHGVFGEYGSQFNFCRLISFLDMLSFTIALNSSGISLLAPSCTANSIMLADYCRKIKAIHYIAVESGFRNLAT